MLRQLVFFLAASSALAEVTHCTAGTTVPLPDPTQPTTQQQKGSSDRPRMVVLPPVDGSRIARVRIVCPAGRKCDMKLKPELPKQSAVAGTPNVPTSSPTSGEQTTVQGVNTLAWSPRSAKAPTIEKMKATTLSGEPTTAADVEEATTLEATTLSGEPTTAADVEEATTLEATTLSGEPTTVADVEEATTLSGEPTTVADVEEATTLSGEPTTVADVEEATTLSGEPTEPTVVNWRKTEPSSSPQSKEVDEDEETEKPFDAVQEEAVRELEDKLLEKFDAEHGLEHGLEGVPTIPPTVEPAECYISKEVEWIEEGRCVHLGNRGKAVGCQSNKSLGIMHPLCVELLLPKIVPTNSTVRNSRVKPSV